MSFSKIIKQVSVVGAFGLLGVMSPDGAQAVTATGNIGVAVTVTANCSLSLVGAPGAAMPGYDYTTGSQETGSISVTCNEGAPWALTMNNGTHTGLSGGARAVSLANSNAPGTPYMTYNLTSVAAWTGTGAVGGAAIPIDLTVDVPGLQAPADGTYNDTIGVTLTY